MQKSQAVGEFAETVLPAIVRRFGPSDVVAARTAWNDYTDALHRDGRITDRQVEQWTQPDIARMIRREVAR